MKKNILLTAGMLLAFSVSVSAATGFSLIVSQATNTSVKQIGSNATVDYGVNGVLGLGADYRFSKDMSVFLKYQIDRELLQSGVPTNAKYSEILLGYNYYWSLGSALEVFIGLNYSLPRQSGTGWAAGVTLESFLGYQAGLNYNINPNLYLNVVYDVYRANIKFSNGTTNGLEDAGIRVGLGCRL